MINLNALNEKTRTSIVLKEGPAYKTEKPFKEREEYSKGFTGH